MSSTPSQTPELEAIVDRWAVPFARAFAEFVKALSNGAELAERKVEPAWVDHGDGFSSREVTPEGDPDLHDKLQKKLLANPMRIGTGGEFDPAIPARHLGNRLREIFEERGIKQSAIARKLGISPSVVNRVLKHPEKSRLGTIRKIANAAGINTSELV